MYQNYLLMQYPENLKKLYLLKQDVMNGLRPIQTEMSLYTTKELRDKVIEKLKKLNEKIDPNSLFIKYTTEDVFLYENESDVPILNYEESGDGVNS